MNRVLEVNPEEGWVRVEAGVVKDALNDALRPHGFFFSPDLSTSNRATLGGMINTDASGAGSLVYGKTSDHVLELTSVLVDGSVLHTAPVSREALESGEKVTDNPLGNKLITEVARRCREQRELIEQRFPKLNRFF